MAEASIGFIGLGSQGAPMAERMLQAGRLMVWARRPESAAELVAKGAAMAASVEELGAACRHVGVCVVDDAGVMDVCDRLIPAMRPGAVLAIHSTILPQTCEELERRDTHAQLRIRTQRHSGNRTLGIRAVQIS